ncbi:MAG: hypothetical protein J0M19_12165 [Sphingomonadales bacterium]|nr:hypothetical protein [Sphingomonadales bacterium]
MEDRSSRALARIEQALARIEAASHRSAPISGSTELADLQGRHDRLKAAVQDSLVQLDQLIEGTQG